jgi:hypothetical protein
MLMDIAGSDVVATVVECGITVLVERRVESPNFYLRAYALIRGKRRLFRNSSRTKNIDLAVNNAREYAHAIAEKAEQTTLPPAAGAEQAGLVDVEPRSRFVLYREIMEEVESSPKWSSRHKANFRTACAGWLRHNGKSFDSGVGPELDTDFDERLDAYLDWYGATGVAGQSIRNHRSLLTAIRRIYRKIYVGVADPDRQNLFSDALTAAIRSSGRSYIVCAREAGVPPATMWRWSRGHGLPAGSSLEHLTRLEGVLELDAGTLTGYVRPSEVVGRVPPTAFARRIWELGQLRYALAPPERMVACGEEYARYKTCDDPHPLRRHRRARWTANVVGEVPSKTMFEGHMRRFVGFCTLPTDHTDPRLRGRGLAIEDVRFVMLVCTDHLKTYLAFRKLRTGHYTNEAVRLLSEALSLLTYVRQRSEQFLPELEFLGRDAPQDQIEFERWCTNQRRELKRFRAVIKPLVRKARVPEHELADILERKSPLSFVFEMLAAMEAARPSRHAPLQLRAEHEALIFTLVAFAAIPLRALNWRVAKIDTHLVKRDGRWWYQASKQEFKNRRYLQKDFRAPIADWAQKYFEEYLTHWRAYLPGSVGPYVLCNINTDSDEGSKGQLSASGLSSRLRRIALKYAERSLGQHWIRHVAVTDFLKRNSYNFFAAAGILNDALATVLREYGHLQTQDHFALFNVSCDDARAIFESSKAA